jgi:hypothetical protein
MKWIFILFVFISHCITDEASHCEKLRSEKGGLTCQNNIMFRELLFEFDENKGLSPRTDSNSRGNQYINYIIISCLAEYKEGEECRKKSHIKPVRSR